MINSLLTKPPLIPGQRWLAGSLPDGSCQCAHPRRANISENLILHGGVTTVGGGRCGSVRVLVVVCVVEVVSHLGIQFLRSLLSRAGVASLARTLLDTLSGVGSTTLGGVGAVLDSRGRLGLNLGLRDALSKRFRLGDKVGRSDDNLDLRIVSIWVALLCIAESTYLYRTVVN